MQKLKRIPLTDRVLGRIDQLARLVGLRVLDVFLIVAILILAVLILWGLT